MTRLSELLDEGWTPSAPEVCDLLRQVGADLARLHTAGAVHGGVTPACLERTPDGGFRLLPADPAGADPWWRGAPEVLDGDAPSPASDTFDLAATVERLVQDVPWELPDSLRTALSRALRSVPEARPSMTALVVCGTQELGDAPVAGPGEPGDPGTDRPEGAGPAGEAGPAPLGLLLPGESSRAEADDRAGEAQRDELAALVADFRAAADGEQQPRRPRGWRRPVVVAAALVLVGVAGVALVAPDGGQDGAATAVEAPAPSATSEAAPTGDAESAEPSEPSGAGEVAEPAGRSAAPRRTPSASSTSTGVPVPVESRAAEEPTARQVQQLLDGRARAWAEQDEEALARVLHPGGPAWQRDLAAWEASTEGRAGAAEGELLGQVVYSVDGLSVESVEGRTHEVLATVTRRVGRQEVTEAMRLTLRPTGDGWRLVDWTS